MSDDKEIDIPTATTPGMLLANLANKLCRAMKIDYPRRVDMIDRYVKKIIPETEPSKRQYEKSNLIDALSKEEITIKRLVALANAIPVKEFELVLRVIDEDGNEWEVSDKLPELTVQTRPTIRRRRQGRQNECTTIETEGDTVQKPRTVTSDRNKRRHREETSE